MKKRNNAGLIKRSEAFLMDMLIIMFPIIILLSRFTDFGDVFIDYLVKKNMERRIEFLLYRNIIRDISFSIWIVTSFICDSSNLNGTLGKKICKIKVVDANGDRLSFKKSVLRNLTKYFSMIILGIGFLIAGVTKEKQAFHDKIAKTFVIYNE